MIGKRYKDKYLSIPIIKLKQGEEEEIWEEKGRAQKEKRQNGLEHEIFYRRD